VKNVRAFTVDKPAEWLRTAEIDENRLHPRWCKSLNPTIIHLLLRMSLKDRSDEDFDEQVDQIIEEDREIFDVLDE